MEQVTQSQQITMSQKSTNNFYKYTYSNSPKNGVQLLCCNMHKRANQNMFCTIFKKPSSLAHFCHFTAIYCKMQGHGFKHQTHTNTHITSLVPLQNG